MKLKRNKFVANRVYSFRVDKGGGFYDPSFKIERRGCSASSHYGDFEQLFDRCRRMRFEDAFWFAREMAKKKRWRFKYYRFIEECDS